MTSNTQIKIGKTVHPLNFQHLGWRDFERMVYAYASKLKQWDNISWLGETGGENGRDIWGVHKTNTYCYQCANYKAIVLPKVTEDIDKLVNAGFIPDHFIVVCGSNASAKMRENIKDYARKSGFKDTQVWSSSELEEKLRNDATDLIKRFFEGETFPAIEKTDDQIVKALSDCFDRPAFTTAFSREVNIPHFEKAITDTIEVLNTGLHRTRDGAVIGNIPSRHQIKDSGIKKQIATIYKQVVKLRDEFILLSRNEEIKPCGCGEADCPVYILSDKACSIMDSIRNSIFTQFKQINPDFDLQLY